MFKLNIKGFIYKRYIYIKNYITYKKYKKTIKT